MCVCHYLILFVSFYICVFFLYHLSLFICVSLVCTSCHLLHVCHQFIVFFTCYVCVINSLDRFPTCVCHHTVHMFLNCMCLQFVMIITLDLCIVWTPVNIKKSRPLFVSFCN